MSLSGDYCLAGVQSGSYISQEAPIHSSDLIAQKSFPWQQWACQSQPWCLPWRSRYLP